MAENVLTENLSEPRDNATAARINIDAADGNLSIDRLGSGEQLLATGTLQYVESQGLPVHTLESGDGQSTLTLKGGTNLRPRFRFPWQACNAETEWQIHLNPEVCFEVQAHSGGGNLKLNLDGMAVTQISADTGGGNIDLVVPGNAANLNVTAKTGAGNVTVQMGAGLTAGNTVKANSGAGNVVVHIPRAIAARIHATTGLGKVIMDPSFSQTARDTYQSPDFENAVNKLEITLGSGAGNVSVDTL